MGTTSAGSTSNRVPRPPHTARQPPYGELNEKVPGTELVERDAAVGARQVLRRHRFHLLGVVLTFAGDDLDLGHTLGEAQRGLEQVGEATLDAGAADEAVDHHLDRVVLVPGEPAATAEIDDLANNNRALV